MNNRPPQHTLTRGARAWLRMGLAGLGGLPGEGKEVLEAGVEPALAELVEDVAEVVPGVAQASLFGAADEGVEDGEAAGAVVAAGEEPVLAADGHGAQRALGVVVVDALGAVVDKDGQRRPLPQRIGDGLAERGLGRCLSAEALKLVVQTLHERLRLGLAATLSFGGVAAIVLRAALDGVELLDDSQRSGGPQVARLIGSVEFPARVRQAASARRGRFLI